MNNHKNTSFDFANIIFSGKCNAKCPYCIGQQLEKKYDSNLDIYPLKGMDTFVELVKKYNIPEVIFT